VELENHFDALLDEQMLLGVDKSYMSLIMEDMTGNGRTLTNFADHNSTINTIKYIDQIGIIIAGDDDGKIIQYSYSSHPESSVKFMKDYGDLGIGSICACETYQYLVICGGFNTYSLKVIDCTKMIIYNDEYTTAIQSIYSLLVFEASPTEILLSINGEGSDYSENKTDIIDITKRFKEPGSMCIVECICKGESRCNAKKPEINIDQIMKLFRKDSDYNVDEDILGTKLLERLEQGKERIIL